MDKSRALPRAALRAKNQRQGGCAGSPPEGTVPSLPSLGPPASRKCCCFQPHPAFSSRISIHLIFILSWFHYVVYFIYKICCSQWYVLGVCLCPLVIEKMTVSWVQKMWVAGRTKGVLGRQLPSSRSCQRRWPAGWSQIQRLSWGHLSPRNHPNSRMLCSQLAHLVAEATHLLYRGAGKSYF